MAGNFFEPRLGSLIRLRMLRPRLQPAIVLPIQDPLHLALRQHHVEALRHHLREIDAAPAHHAVHCHGRPIADPLRLIVPMLERFIATDRGFAKTKRSEKRPAEGSSRRSDR